MDRGALQVTVYRMAELDMTEVTEHTLTTIITGKLSFLTSINTAKRDGKIHQICGLREYSQLPQEISCDLKAQGCATWVPGIFCCNNRHRMGKKDEVKHFFMDSGTAVST